MRQKFTIKTLVYHFANLKGHPKRLIVSTLLGNYHQTSDESFLFEAYEALDNPVLGLLCTDRTILYLN